MVPLLAILALSGLVVASPVVDPRALALERVIALAPAEQERNLANLFYPNGFTKGPALQVASEAFNAWTNLAHFQAAVYCGPDQVQAWNCGVHCDTVGKPRIVMFGGDNEATPWHYVANNGSHVLVGIAGTNTKSPESIANDINVFTRRPSSEYFPGAGKAEVHSGFYGAFTRLAGGIATAVQGEVQNGTTNVIVLGHSLGAAVGELLAVYLAKRLDGAAVTARAFASPRVGNVPWANYVDATFPHGSFQYMTNFNDPVPRLPPKDWGFRHPSNEVFITGIGSQQALACSGQENKKCSAQFADPVQFFTSLLTWMDDDVHNGPYAGVKMGNVNCRK